MKGDENSELFDQEVYQSAVGRLLYLSTRTRPDIAFAVSTLAKFTSRPTEAHWTAVKHLLRYIAGTREFGLLFTMSDSSDCTGFSDSDWAGDQDDRKSTSLGEGLTANRCSSRQIKQSSKLVYPSLL